MKNNPSENKKIFFRNKLSIRQVLILWGAGISVFIAILILVVVSVSTLDTLREKIYSDIDISASKILAAVDWREHTPLIDEDLVDIDEDTTYAICDGVGNIYTGHIPAGIDKDSFKDITETKKLSVNNKKYYVKKVILKDKNTYEDTEKNNEYFLYVFLDSHEMTLMFKNVARIVSIAALISVIIMILTSIFVSRYLADPITRLSESTARAIKTRDYAKPLSLDKNNIYLEIYELSESYEYLMKQVKKTIDAQRRFNCNISHELRTPVTVLIAQCENAKKHTNDESVLKTIEVIERQTGRIKDLITNLFELSRIEIEGSGDDIESVSIDDVIVAICDDISFIKDRDDLFNLNLESINIMANTVLIYTMLRNLTDNAVRYSADDGVVDIRLHRDTEFIRISIRDYGIGIDSDILESIFEPFYRAEGSRSSEGFGLGLPLADRIASLYGGKIEVKSKPGEGSEFTVILPEIL